MNRLTTFFAKARRIHLLTGVALLAGLCVVPTAQAQARYSYSADGSEVTDSTTGLTWRRCSEGMVWSAGTCNGTAASFTHEQALTHATTQTGWRLPNVKELFSIADKSRSGPAIDVIAFPAIPSDLFWSSTAFAGNAYFAWNVYFDDGVVGRDYRVSSGHVRLVR